MSRRILLVEDEADLAATCVRLLQRRGWQVETADTRGAALGAVASRPALAIVDRQLPDGDGLDVLRAARAAGTPVIMISGRDWAETRRLALGTGAAAFLGKPFSTRELLDLVGDILGEPPRRARPAPPPASTSPENPTPGLPG
ncbi:MAG TPA: response regulator transcription factor [Methylomirabilota bacterium]|nr:response regulator transcription factor [Methylomirabilota bacterium]